MTRLESVKTILVATDFSEDSEAAVDWAARTAQDRGARLALVHAAMLPQLVAPEFVPMPDAFYAELCSHEREELDSLAARWRSTGLDVTADFTCDRVIPDILDAAEKRRADVIVAGTRGLTGWKRVLLGSVSARLVRLARCPVVTVHGGEDSHPRLPVKTVLMPTDFSDDASLAAEAAARLLGADPDHRVVLLHVYRYPIVFYGAPTPVITGCAEEVAASARRRIEALADELREGGLTVETRIDEGIPSEKILEHAAAVGADLIAMGTHGRSGLDRLLIGSTAEQVLPAAPCPVLTVHCRSEG